MIQISIGFIIITDIYTQWSPTNEQYTLIVHTAKAAPFLPFGVFVIRKSNCLTKDAFLAGGDIIGVTSISP